MYKNDIGLSWEFSKFNDMSNWVLQPYISSNKLLIINDGDEMVLRARIQEMILKAVVEERQACADIANEFKENCDDAWTKSHHLIYGNETAEAIALNILSRNYTEAKKQDTYNVSEDEKV